MPMTSFISGALLSSNSIRVNLQARLYHIAFGQHGVLADQGDFAVGLAYLAALGILLATMLVVIEIMIYLEA